MKLTADKIHEVLRQFDVAVVYLFGSTAANRSRADSDVDVAFLPQHPCDPYAVFQAAQELASIEGREVDLVDLSRASAVMRAQIVTTGRRLLVTDPRRADEFEMYALSDYARANEERRRAFGDYLDFGSIAG